jgi:hypothetical protein
VKPAAAAAALQRGDISVNAATIKSTHQNSP